jgi:secretion/DNA translocation related CpaE-like protein
METSASPGVLVVTADDVLLDHALAICAAAGVEPDVVADPGAVVGHWPAAALVLVGADQADRAVKLGVPRRGQLLLLDVENGRDLSGPSVRLGAPVAVLPGGASELLATVSAAGRRSAERGRVVAVVGGSGGVGASTVAAALAFVAARSDRRAMVVDLDPLGGGLDLLVGAERVPGWRWPRLSRARGQLGDLGGQLPHLDGVDVVAMGRGERLGHEPSEEAVDAVVGSGLRTHDLVVLDPGRGAGPLWASGLRLAEVGLLLVAGDVRGVAAGRETYARLGSGEQSWHLLVRRPRSGGLSPADAAEGLHPRLAGVVDDDPGIGLAAQRGEPPARSPRGQLARVCRHLLGTVVWPGTAA